MSGELPNYYKLVSESFSQRFIHYEEIAEALCAGYMEVHHGQNDGMNVLLYGDGGYGKSSMSLDFAKTILSNQKNVGQFRTLYIQSVGASTREDELWGGLDLKALREGDSISYLLEKSFLNYHIVIFEEFFDLPGRILFDFKDTLSAREFRRGAHNKKMESRFIIACTNKNPEDIAKMSASHDALVQRFPFHVKAEWPSHRNSDYLQMFMKQMSEGHKSLAPLMASICSASIAKGMKPIPPRIAQDAMKSVISRARSRGRQVVIPEDLTILRSIQRFNVIWPEVQRVIEDALHKFGGTLELNKLSVEANQLIARLSHTHNSGIEEFVAIDSDLEMLRRKINNISIPGEKAEGFELKRELLRRVTDAYNSFRQERKGKK